MHINPIRQNDHYNNKQNFKALKGIEYGGTLFNPKEDICDAKIVKAFLDSDAFKRFTDIFDAKVTFYRTYHNLMDRHSTISVVYRDKKEDNAIRKDSLIKRIFRKKKKPVDEKYPYEWKIWADSSENCTEDTLQHEIENTSFESLMSNYAEYLERERIELKKKITLNKLNSELEDKLL